MHNQGSLVLSLQNVLACEACSIEVIVARGAAIGPAYNAIEGDGLDQVAGSVEDSHGLVPLAIACEEAGRDFRTATNETGKFWTL